MTRYSLLLDSYLWICLYVMRVYFTTYRQVSEDNIAYTDSLNWERTSNAAYVGKFVKNLSAFNCRMRQVVRCNGIKQKVEAPSLDYDIIAPEKKTSQKSSSQAWILLWSKWTDWKTLSGVFFAHDLQLRYYWEKFYWAKDLYSQKMMLYIKY